MKTEKCPVEQALQVIGGKWKIPIIHHLNEKPHRFGKLKSRLTKVTQQMLSKQLKEMENDGLVKRTVLSVMPPSVVCSLIDFGKSAIPVLQSLYSWSTHHDSKITKLIKKNHSDQIQITN